MGLLTHYIRDDRGERVAAVNIYMRRSGRARHEGFPPVEYKRMRRFVFEHTRAAPFDVMQFIIFIAATLPTMFLAGWLKHAQISKHFVPLIVVGAVVLVFALGSSLLLRTRFIADAPIIRSEFKYRRRCASCGYSLAELTPDEDGCTVCPECGAAWRLKEAGA